METKLKNEEIDNESILKEKWRLITNKFKTRKKDYNYTEVIFVDFKNKRVIRNEYTIKNESYIKEIV